MSLREHARNWLGIDYLDQRINRGNAEMNDIGRTLTKLRTHLQIHNDAIARIITKLDQHLARDPQSPEMRAESAEISKLALERIAAEAAARAPYNY
jgi:hypothetical protein